MTRVSDRGLYQGYAITGIDGKGRVAIPASLRSTIEKNGEGRIVTITREAGAPFLSGNDNKAGHLLRQQITSDESAERVGGGSFDRRNALRRSFGPVEEVPFDASGRFILPKFMRDKAQLTDTAFFFGLGDMFEIWNPHVLLATPSVDELMREVCEWLLSDRGAS